MADPTLRVLHVVSTNERRGAEMFVADLLRVTDDPTISQRVAVMRDVDYPPAPFGAAVAMAGPNRGLLPLLNVNPATAIALRRLVRGWRPDVIVAHGGEALKYAVPVRARTGLVYRRVGATPGWMAGRGRRRAYAALMGRADVTVAVAEATRIETVAGFGLDPVRTMVIPNAVDHERVMPRRARSEVRASLGIPEDASLTLFVGALNDEKDPLAALEVFGRALPEVAGAIMIVAGEGPLRGEIEDSIRGAALADRVVLVGARSDVGDLMGAADALLLTSRTEGMPGCVIEAGMLGLPVVGFAVGGVPEVVTDRGTGMLVAAGDGIGLSRRLIEVLSDGALRASMGGAARDRCLEGFDVRSVAPAWARLYRRLAHVEDAARTGDVR